jgi:hypothetical protein
MPAIQGTQSTAAGATTANVLAGSLYEFAPWDAFVEFGVVAEAAGESRVTISTGQQVVLEESPVSRAARVPIYPDDYTVTDVVAAGERIVIKHRNTGAGANTLFWAIKLTPQ